MPSPSVTLNASAEYNFAGTGSVDVTFTPVANKIYLLGLHYLTEGTGSHPTLSVTNSAGGGNLASGWSLIAHANQNDDDAWRAGAAVYKAVAVAAPSSTTTVSVSPGGVSTYGWTLNILEISDSDAYSSLVVQSKISASTVALSNSNISVERTYTLDAAPATGNTVITFNTCNDDNPATAQMTPTTGWTELLEDNAGGHVNPRQQIQWRTGSTSSTVAIPACASGYGTWASVSVEIAAVSSSSPAIFAENGFRIGLEDGSHYLAL